MTTTDIAGIELQEPGQMDWDNYNPGKKFIAPPQVEGPDGKPVVYYGTLPLANQIKQEVNDEKFRVYVLDPIKIVKSGSADGYELRFTRASLKRFTNKKTGEPINASMVGNLLRSVGVTAKPQKTAEYDAAVKLAGGKTAAFTIDWYGKSKETGEAVRGYKSFPEDPANPGQRKAVLKKGDTYLDKDGNPQTLQADVLFANAQVKFFVDPNRK